VNFSEYEDVVQKVLKRRPTRAITVFVDMKDVDCYTSYPISSSHASLMLLTYLICTTGPFLPSTGLTSDFAAI
jgi:hypothetical protein